MNTFERSKEIGKLWPQIQELSEQGNSNWAIARMLKISRFTVREWLRRGGPPEPGKYGKNRKVGAAQSRRDPEAYWRKKKPDFSY